MTRRRRSMAALGSVVVAIGLAGCGAGNLVAPEAPASGSAASAAARISPSPTVACPMQGEEPPAGCAPYDGEAAMLENERYRERHELSPENQVRADDHATRVTAAFELAVQSRPIDRLEATRVLAPLGFDGSSVQASGRSDGPGGLAIGIDTDAGCVYGGIRGTVVDLEAGGGIADGGCLEAVGH